MELGELITTFRKQENLTIEELAEKSGVPKGTLNKIIGGVTKAPTLDTVKSIAFALGKTLDDFDDQPVGKMFTRSEQKHIEKYRALDKHGKETLDWNLHHEYARCTTPEPAPAPIPLPETVEEEERPLYNVTPIRQSDYKASAGTGAYLGPESFTIIYVKENELTSRGSFCIPVSGNSMEPYYYDKDLLIVEKCEELEPGEIGIFTLRGEAYVKKLGKGQLISLNPDYKPIPMDESILLNGRVIGVLEPEWIVG